MRQATETAVSASISTPVRPSVSAVTVIAIALLPITFFILWRTAFGLRLRSCGEAPYAAATLGVNVMKYKYIAVVTSGALAGVGGAFLAIVAAGIAMSSGRYSSLRLPTALADAIAQIDAATTTTSAPTAKMKRTFPDLVSWLVRDNPVPPGSVLLTGTGLVPPDEFTLLPGHVVEIHVPEIGTLTNPVVRAADVLARATP